MSNPLQLQLNLAHGGTLSNEYHGYVRRESFDPHAHEGNGAELAYIALGLAGETGEFVDEVKKCIRESGYAVHTIAEFGDTPRYTKLVDELGDIMWYIERAMAILRVTREEVIVRNTYKLHKRYPQHPWPFTAPFTSYEEVQHLIEVEPAGEDEDVCID